MIRMKKGTYLDSNEEKQDEDMENKLLPPSPEYLRNIFESCLFYCFQLIQIVYVIIFKWMSSDEIGISSPSTQNNSREQVGRSTLNICFLMVNIVALISTTYIYKRRLYYEWFSYVHLCLLMLMATYVLSKPTPIENILYFSESDLEVDDNLINMSDLYYLLMLGEWILQRRTYWLSLISVITKIILHVAVIIQAFQVRSGKVYVPLVMCAIQYLVKDLIFLHTEILKKALIRQAKRHSFKERKDVKINIMRQRSSLASGICTPNETCNIDGKTKDMPLHSNLKRKERDQLKGTERDEKWKQYLNEIPAGILLVNQSLDQIQFANDFIKDFFVRNFLKLREEDILEMVIREIKFRILSQIVSTQTSNEKKRITRFSSSAKNQIRETISNAEKNTRHRSKTGQPSSLQLNSILHASMENQSRHQLINTKDFSGQNTLNIDNTPFQRNGNSFCTGLDINKKAAAQYSYISDTESLKLLQTTAVSPKDTTQVQLGGLDFQETLEYILQNLCQRDIENSTVEIYAKVLSADSKEMISLKGKVHYRNLSDEYLIILEDITKYERMSNIADRDDYKNRLISSFSHELRTPLNSSMGFLQSALLDTSLDNKIKELYLIPAYQSLKLQFYFINDILDFSQILAKRDLQLNFQKFNIQKLISDLHDLYQNSFDSKGIILNFSVDQKIENEEICTDYDRLMQVMVNLINNSLRFTFQGQVSVNITPSSCNNLIIEVIDQGEGMNMKQFEQLTKKLSEFGASAPITETQHTGFGLTISQIIVSILASENHSDLELRQTEGGGCTFSFWIENILNLEMSLAIPQHNAIKMEAVKKGIQRQEARKKTYAHKVLEKKSFMSSSRGVTRGNTVLLTKTEGSKAQLNKNILNQASFFQKTNLVIAENDGTFSSENQPSESNKLVDSEHLPQLNGRQLPPDATQFSNINSFNVFSNHNVTTYSNQKKKFVTISQGQTQFTNSNFIKQRQEKTEDKLQDATENSCGLDDIPSDRECFKNQIGGYNFCSIIQKTPLERKQQNVLKFMDIKERSQTEPPEEITHPASPSGDSFSHRAYAFPILYDGVPTSPLHDIKRAESHMPNSIARIIRTSQQVDQQQSYQLLFDSMLNPPDLNKSEILIKYPTPINCSNLIECERERNSLQTYEDSVVTKGLTNVKDTNGTAIPTKIQAREYFQKQDKHNKLDKCELLQSHKLIKSLTSWPSSVQTVNFTNNEKKEDDFQEKVTSPNNSRITSQEVNIQREGIQETCGKIVSECVTNQDNLLKNDQEPSDQMAPKSSDKETLQQLEEVEECINCVGQMRNEMKGREHTLKSGEIVQRCECKRVLCVDDEIFNLQVLMFLFQKLGYSIERAYNGKEAIKCFVNCYHNRSMYQCSSPNCTVFKAVILDCNMPIMNGWECARELRILMAQNKLPSIPIIALTAYVALQAHIQCIESGMDEVINKPVDIKVLKETVESFIQLYETEK